MTAAQLVERLHAQGVQLWLDGDQLRCRARRGVLEEPLLRELEQRKRDVVAFLRTAGGRPGAASPLDGSGANGGRYEPFPLTDIQQAYLVGRTDLFELGSVGCHMYFELQRRGLDPERLEWAWGRLIERHDMLRAVLLPDGRQQILESVPCYRVPVLDLRETEPDERDAALGEIRRSKSHEVRDLEQWPSFDLRITLLPDDLVRVHVSFDLLFWDAPSAYLLAREWGRFYEEPDAAPPPLEFSFRDYIETQQSKRDGGRHEAARRYWRQRAKTLPPAPELPLNEQAVGSKAPRFERLRSELEPEQWRTLRERARGHGLTPAGLLIAAYAEVMEAWSRSPCFTISVTTFNRRPVHPQVGAIVGEFTSVDLLEIDARREGDFAARARRVHAQLLEDLDHAEVSGVTVAREAARAQGWVARGPRAVVFTSMLGQRMTDEEDRPWSWLGEMRYGISQTPQVLLDHQVMEHDGALVFQWDAASELFAPGVLQKMFEAYEDLLDRLVREPDWTRLCGIPLPREQRERRERSNRSRGSVEPRLLHELFESQVDERPEAPAVISPEETLSYASLERRSNALAWELRDRGAGPNRLVAIVGEKGWEQAVAVIAVLKAGAAYLPVDPRLPEARRSELLRQGEVALALAQPHWIEAIRWPDDVTVLPVADEEAEGTRPEPIQRARDLAYVIFTSGSTGRPKGVMIDHRGAVNTVTDVNERFGVGPEDRGFALSSLSFDLSAYDLLGLLAAGGSIVLPGSNAPLEPARWAEAVVRQGVSVWNSVPALAEMLVEHVEETAGRDVLAPLRLMLLSGDWIPTGLPDRLRELCPSLQVVSLGGATEASIWSIAHVADAATSGARSIPYGRPLRNQTVQVLDHRMEPRPDWVPGEIWIGGLGVAAGYWRDEERTETSFIEHPRSGERLYRTGDFGRFLPNGEIELLGRRDHQLKIRGYRIEAGEVESVLARHPSVRSAVVDVVESDGGGKQLVAFVVGDRQGDLRQETKRQAFAQRDPRDEVGAVPPDEGAEHDPTLDTLQRLEFKLSEPGIRADRAEEPISLPGCEDLAALEAVHRRRQSHRRFGAAPVTLEALGTLLQVLAPLDIEDYALPKYRYPSAGDLHPVQVYVSVKEGRVKGLEAGSYYFHPRERALMRLAEGQPEEREQHGPANRQTFDESVLTLHLVGRLDAIRPLYGSLARDFCLLEAGYMGQLLMEVAPTLGLGLCPIGALDFEALRPRFELEPNDFLTHSLLAGPAPDSAPPAESTIRSAEGAHPSGGSGSLEEAIRGFLREALPQYMVPSRLVLVDAMPLTPNGKIDRSALRACAARAQPVEPRPPSSQCESEVARIAREVLGMTDLSADENFFDAGADSVHLVRMHRRLQELTDASLSVVELFRNPTVASLARRLEAQDTTRASDTGKMAERAERRRNALGRARAAGRPRGASAERRSAEDS